MNLWGSLFALLLIAVGSASVLADDSGNGGGIIGGGGVKITSVVPDSGSSDGGTPISIHGEGFVPQIEVFIGGQACERTAFVDETLMTCITPPHDAGVVSVEARIGTASSVAKDAFNYVPESLPIPVPSPMPSLAP